MRTQTRRPRPFLLGRGYLVGALALAAARVVAGCGAGRDASANTAPSAYQGTTLDGAAADFRLVDQGGAKMALLDFQGKVVILAFLDPECADTCPLTASQFFVTSQALGDDAGRVAFVAVNVNPTANSVADVRAASAKWGVGGLASWHFLTGERAELQPVWRAYNVEAEGPPKPGKPGEKGHTPGVFVIDQRGTERWYVSPFFEGAPALSAILAKHINALLRG